MLACKHFPRRGPICKVNFVSNTAPVSGMPGKDRPKSLTGEAIAAWVESLGGQARFGGGPYHGHFAGAGPLHRCPIGLSQVRCRRSNV